MEVKSTRALVVAVALLAVCCWRGPRDPYTRAPAVPRGAAVQHGDNPIGSGAAATKDPVASTVDQQPVDRVSVAWHPKTGSRSGSKSYIDGFKTDDSAQWTTTSYEAPVATGHQVRRRKMLVTFER
jgi:hypothetical protein